VIKDFDLATGKMSTVALGESVFLSADGRYLYLVQTQTELLELPAARQSSRPRTLALPVGWRLIWSGISVTNGIVVEAVHPLGAGPRRWASGIPRAAQ